MQPLESSGNGEFLVAGLFSKSQVTAVGAVRIPRTVIFNRDRRKEDRRQHGHDETEYKVPVATHFAPQQKQLTQNPERGGVMAAGNSSWCKKTDYGTVNESF